MQIRDMFYKRIDRDIKGVIKIGQEDEDIVYQELEEYVVTRELKRYFSDFFEAYKKGIIGYTDKMGVWISGFFGSGKSHFLSHRGRFEVTPLWYTIWVRLIYQFFYSLKYFCL